MKSHYIIVLAVIMGVFFLPFTGCQEPVQSRVEGQAKAPKGPEAVSIPPKPEQAAETKNKADEAGPKITFEKEVHDFGEIGPGSKKTCEFKFTNTGKSLLEIKKVQGCCGVTTKLDKMQYAPNENGTIKVEYNASTVASVISRQLYVLSNDKTTPRAPLTIKAKIVPKISFEPQRGLRFLLKDEQPNYPDITITSLDGRPFAIKGFKATGNCITVDYDPNEEATKFVLHPKVDMEKLRARPNGIISISLTHPEGNSVTIPFSTRPRFQITPPQLIAFNAEPGKPIIRKIWVLNNYRENFEIESTSSENGIIKVQSQNPIKNGYQFMLEIMPPANNEGETRFNDIFYVNIKGGEKLEINCRGFYLRRR
jgi:hypothetical protein